MSEEIIKLLEYITSNPEIRSFASVYLIISAVVTAAVLFFVGFVFVKVFKEFKDFDKDFRRF